VTISWNVDQLDYGALEHLRDACNRRMLQLRRTDGLALADLLELLDDVKGTLRDQRKDWYSLERWQWQDGTIRFWLNPRDQPRYRAGWFTIDELIAWTHDQGPIVLADLDPVLAAGRAISLSA
jgi:hypothetical protein